MKVQASSSITSESTPRSDTTNGNVRESCGSSYEQPSAATSSQGGPSMSHVLIPHGLRGPEDCLWQPTAGPYPPRTDQPEDLDWNAFVHVSSMGTADGQRQGVSDLSPTHIGMHNASSVRPASTIPAEEPLDTLVRNTYSRPHAATTTIADHRIIVIKLPLTVDGREWTPGSVIVLPSGATAEGPHGNVNVRASDRVQNIRPRDLVKQYPSPVSSPGPIFPMSSSSSNSDSNVLNQLQPPWVIGGLHPECPTSHPCAENVFLSWDWASSLSSAAPPAIVPDQPVDQLAHAAQVTLASPVNLQYTVDGTPFLPPEMPVLDFPTIPTPVQPRKGATAVHASGRRHIRASKTKSEKSIQCSQCSRRFTRPEDLTRHARTHIRAQTRAQVHD